MSTPQNPQNVRVGERVTFLSSPTAGAYEVLRVDRYGRVLLALDAFRVLDARASDLVQA